MSEAEAAREEAFGTACHLLIEGDFQRAAEAYSKLLEEHGDHPGVRHNYALALECGTRFEEAKAQYTAAIAAFPDYVPSYLGLANCAFYAGDAEQAEGLLRSAREKDPTDPRAAILLSEILLLRGMEREGIEHHLDALRLIDGSNCVCTDSHPFCYGDFGIGGPGFYMFWERSLLQRNGFPDVPPIKGRASSIVVVLAAHGGNAADIGRRVRRVTEVWSRDRVVLVALDDIATRILREHEPDMACMGLSFQLHEIPAILLHIGRTLVTRGYSVLLPSDEGSDVAALEWAKSELKYKDMAVTAQGDLCASSPDPLDPRRVPPLLNRGQCPASDTFAKIFAQK